MKTTTTEDKAKSVSTQNGALKLPDKLTRYPVNMDAMTLLKASPITTIGSFFRALLFLLNDRLKWLKYDSVAF